MKEIEREPKAPAVKEPETLDVPERDPDQRPDQRETPEQDPPSQEPPLDAPTDPDIQEQGHIQA